MKRQRTTICLLISAILLVAACGFCWYWHATIVDRRVHSLVHELAGWPDSKYEKFLKKCKLDFLVSQKPQGGYKFELIEELMKIGQAATPELVSLLSDDDLYVRSLAAFLLGEIGGPQVVDPLIKQLEKDASPDVRCCMAKAFGRIGDQRAIEPLIAAVKKEKRNRLRDAEIQTIGKIGGERAAEALAEIIIDGRDFVDCYAMAKALGKSNPKVMELLLQALQSGKSPKIRQEITFALGCMKDKLATEALIGIMQRDKEQFFVRQQAIYSLGSIGDSRAVKPLIGLFQTDKTASTFRTVVVALGMIGDSQAIDPLITMLKEKNDHDLTGDVAYALGRIHSPRAYEPLLEIFQKEKRYGHRSLIVSALGELGDKRAMETLIKALDDEDVQVQMQAIKALGDLGDSRAIGTLKQIMLNSRDICFRKIAAVSLGKMGDHSAIGPLLSELQNDFVYNYYPTTFDIVMALGESGDYETIRFLRRKMIDNIKTNLNARAKKVYRGESDPGNECDYEMCLEQNKEIQKAIDKIKTSRRANAILAAEPRRMP